MVFSVFSQLYNHQHYLIPKCPSCPRETCAVSGHCPALAMAHLLRVCGFASCGLFMSLGSYDTWSFASAFSLACVQGSPTRLRVVVLRCFYGWVIADVIFSSPGNIPTSGNTGSDDISVQPFEDPPSCLPREPHRFTSHQRRVRLRFSASSPTPVIVVFLLQSIQ